MKLMRPGAGVPGQRASGGASWVVLGSGERAGGDGWGRPCARELLTYKGFGAGRAGWDLGLFCIFLFLGRKGRPENFAQRRKERKAVRMKLRSWGMETLRHSGGF